MTCQLARARVVLTIALLAALLLGGLSARASLDTAGTSPLATRVVLLLTLPSPTTISSFVTSTLCRTLATKAHPTG